MSSADSLQPESIDPDTQQKLGPINTSLTNAGIVGRRIRLNILDKQSVEEDLRKVLQIGSDIRIAVVEIPGPDAAPLKNPDGRMLLIPSQIGPQCTLQIKQLPDSKILWEADKKFVIEKSAEVEISPGDRRAIVIIIGRG